jgi:hypothetical protein
MTPIVITPKKLVNLDKLAKCRKKLLVSKRPVQLTGNPVGLWLTLGISYRYPTAKGLKYLTCILQERPEYISFILQQNVGNILPVAEGFVYFICTL